MTTYRRRFLAALAAVVSLVGLTGIIAASPAAAAPRTYEVSGVADYGWGTVTITGTFTYDPELCPSNPCPSAYSNVNFLFVLDPTMFPYPVTVTSAWSTSTDQTLVIVENTVLEFTLVFDAPIAPSPVPVIDVGNSALVTEGGPASTLTFDPVVVLPDPDPPVPPTSPELVVASRPATAKLPRSGQAVLVARAHVTPSSAGAIRSIRVSCGPQSRGDVRYCRYSANKRTGRVVVTTLGKAKISVRVTIKTRSKSSTYRAQTWSKVWRSR